MTDEALKLEAQAALTELMAEGHLPFKLEAKKLVNAGSSQYTVHFYDSRLRSITVTWEADRSFKEIFRAAVLDQISRLSGPLNKKKP